MFVQVVTIRCQKGLEEQLLNNGKKNLISYYQYAGCVEVDFLEPNTGHPPFTYELISIWENEETLNTMKNSLSYRELLNSITPIVYLLTEVVYSKNQSKYEDANVSFIEVSTTRNAI
ncbi:hypothetical protein [Halalkalibacter alkaliphilus]|uniref:ABM domain-containing protein n=1 Tax=Halalkalibacter alkaliphilus TaxID=2917993 RepID=A0A9X2I5Y0_9BACI|nr:hypothetical protein [Halalkalibacter alkaliphilus]MCL7748582.1 hypothetical protein [Halalkalibacter alkaliphilus]